MSDKKIQVELDEAEARRFLGQLNPKGDVWLNPVRRAIEAVLPPEHPEGTIAWIHWPGSLDGKGLAVRINGQWAGAVYSNGEGYSHWDAEGAKVEPLRVLADDEIAVKRPRWLDPDTLEISAEDFRKHAELGGWVQQQACLAFADALDAEATS